jgi:glutathione synthase/RimK-type ligase-like ATP-grasp enzyme
MTRVALVTAATARDLDEDLPPLRQALERFDVPHEVAVWDDAKVDWASFDLVVVRSTWDYVPRRDEFIRWAERVSSVSRLANPAAILRWNTDKRYLRELAGRGLPVVPTHWLEPGGAVEIPFESDVVVKPVVSCGAKDTARYAPDQRAPALAHARGLLAQGRGVMIQPYLARLDEAGETAAVYLGGTYSHAIRKGAILGSKVELVEGLFAKEDIRSREPDAAERELADRTLSLVPGGPEGLLYARVDMAPGPDGRPVLLELETTEPSLFFGYAPGSADRFARAIRDATI